jgi:hypothetical protein
VPFAPLLIILDPFDHLRIEVGAKDTDGVRLLLLFEPFEITNDAAEIVMKKEGYHS